MTFEFFPCQINGIKINGLYEIQPKIFGDKRGYFLESYNERDFSAAGITTNFVQDNESNSFRNVLRGLHFQKSHAQAKLIRVIAGKALDIVVDLRNDSPTFGKYHSTVLDAEIKNQFYVPRGFAHGFFVLSETATFAYKCDDFYDPASESGIIWNDKTIGIDWNLGNGTPILSEKDLNLPPFDENKKYFSLDGKWIGD